MLTKEQIKEIVDIVSSAVSELELYDNWNYLCVGIYKLGYWEFFRLSLNNIDDEPYYDNFNDFKKAIEEYINERN